MPILEAPPEESNSAPQSPSSVGPSPTPSEISSASPPDSTHVQPTPLFRALAMRPPEPEQPSGQDELERRLPGYQRIVIPRDLTLIELLKQSSGVATDEDVLHIREVQLRVIAERVGLRRLHVLAPLLRSLTLDGSALCSLRELGIGLVHLKVLSINRCGLTCLDGLWGLLKLRELYAAGNQLQELHPLAALQKLHTLDLANNPIADAGRVWTLGVCSALRNLTLRGTPASDLPDYVEQVANVLPTLTHLDGRPLHAEDEAEDIADDGGSESEEEPSQLPPRPPKRMAAEPKPGPSGDAMADMEPFLELDPEDDDYSLESLEASEARKLRRCRPATTEGAGVRPEKPVLPRRPKTALERPEISAPTRLQIMNTLMDEDWRCSGSKLTSHGAVCGNLARALRRPASAHCSPSAADVEIRKQMGDELIKDATRILAAEIPRLPRLEDWAKFREETGIDIRIDFNEWPKPGDPDSAIARIEQIEKETSERFKEGASYSKNYDTDVTARFNYGPLVTTDYQDWKLNAFGNQPDPTDLDTLFSNVCLERANDDPE